MAVSPVRALLHVHLSASWRQSQLDVGPVGAVAAVSLLALLAVVVALPGLTMFAAGGYYLGTRLSDPDVVHALGAMLAGLAILGGSVGRSRVLDWESSRIYPLRLRSLFLAELLAGAGDLLPLVLGALAGSLLLGVGLARPQVIPLLPVTWVVTYGSLLLLRHLRGGLAAHVARHLKIALVVIVVLCLLVPLITPHLGGAGALVASRVLDLWPTTQSMQGVRDAADGHWAQALVRQVYPVLVLAVLFVAAALTLQREATVAAGPSRSRASGTRLWTFSTAIGGVARLQWVSMLRSSMGIMAFVAPPLILYVSRGAFSGGTVGDMWLVPLTLTWLALLNAPVQVNQFGLDGRSVAGLLVLPIRSRDLLAGKSLGLAVYHLPQLVLVLALLVLTRNVGLAAVPPALCLAACQFLLAAGIGHWTSVEMPRPLPRNAFKSTARTNPSPILMIAALAVTVLGGVVFGGAYVFIAQHARQLLLPAMTALLAGTALVYRIVLLPLGARRLEGRREFVMKALA